MTIAFAIATMPAAVATTSALGKVNGIPDKGAERTAFARWMTELWPNFT
jgi:hypothetical protein